MTRTAQLTPDLTADAFAERLFSSSLATVECLSVYVGDRLGWYESLAADGPATPADLAGRTGTCERYAREWLEQQAVYGILLTDPADPERRYELPPGVREVLTDEHSLLYLGPLPRMFAAVGAHLPNLLDAYRTGGGVSWQDLGADARESQAAINRPWFERSLADALHGVADVDEVLRRPGARIADVGCGAGWSTLALARAYPEARGRRHRRRRPVGGDGARKRRVGFRGAGRPRHVPACRRRDAGCGRRVRRGVRVRVPA